MDRHADDLVGQLLGVRRVRAGVRGQERVDRVDRRIEAAAVQAVALAHHVDQLVAPGAGPLVADGQRIQVEGVLLARRIGRQRQLRHAGQQLVALGGDAAATGDEAVELLQLDEADGGLHLRHDVARAPRVVEPAVHADAVRVGVKVLVVGDDHPTLAEGGHVLHRVEGIDRGISLLADLRALVVAADGAGRVKDDLRRAIDRMRMAGGDLQILVHGRAEAVDADRQDRAGARADLPLDVGRVEHEVRRAALAPDPLAAGAHHAERRGVVVDRRDDHLVAGLQLQAAHDDVDARAAAVDGDRVLRADVLAHGGLELEDRLGAEAEALAEVHGGTDGLRGRRQLLVAVHAAQHRLGVPAAAVESHRFLDFLVGHHDFRISSWLDGKGEAFPGWPSPGDDLC